MFVSAVALLALAGAAHAQPVQLGFRTRTNVIPTVSGAATAVIDIAVTAHVTGGRALAGFDFDIGLAGESQSWGTLQVARIRNTGNTAYNPDGAAWPAGAAVGQFGVAASYSYLPGLQPPKFNGNVNSSIGTFTDNPNEHEIGLIGGLSSGNALLQTPGVDDDGTLGFDNNPDTWAGPAGGIPTEGDAFGPNAALSPAVGSAYFAQGSTIDIYHFKYTVTNFTERDIVFQIRNAHASTFSQFQFSYANDIWGIDSTAENTVGTNSMTIHVTPTPSTVALLGLGGLVAVRRRRA
jgi:hypothetical protein